VPSFKPAYLIHGDDHGRIVERRAKLRAMAEAESGSNGVELFEQDACTPAIVASALSAMTFALGRRFVIADGVERWKEADVAPVAAAMEGMDAETLTVAFFAREEGRTKAPEALHKAVKAAGGQVATEKALKAYALPKWVTGQATEIGLELDDRAARALVAQVGERRQRLVRELEKLQLEYGTGAHIGVDEVHESCASSAERQAWALGDALIAGDEKAAMRTLLELREQGVRLPSVLYHTVRRVRYALIAAEQLAAGRPASQVRKDLPMHYKAAEEIVDVASSHEPATYRRALILLADLETESRGGGPGGGALTEDTAAVRAVIAATS
jgi:DNA polymerase-3 subunit delta